MSAAPQPPTGHPCGKAEAHDYALAWVAVLLARGYTVEKALAADFDGGGSVHTAGWSLFDGKIHIANCYSPRRVNGHFPPWSFPFAVLAAELHAPQQADLFQQLL